MRRPADGHADRISWYRSSLGATTTNTALTICNELVAGGFSDWRLATIDELRKIIHDCPATTTGGGCGVTNTCWQETCWSEAACGGCAMKGGPGDKGCYTDPWLDDQCHLVISATKVQSTGVGDSRSWFVTFYDGRIAVNPSGSPIISGFARCVRGP